MLYFDNASTTKISTESLNAYIEASDCFYNPSSLYAPAVKSKNLIEDARKSILNKLKGKPNSTLIFTGSASESNNAVLNSVITRKDRKYLFSAGEHSSVYETAKKYKEEGYNIVFIPLKKNGGVDIDALMKEMDSTVALVSIIHVSNETGAINDVQSISQMVKKINPQAIVHVDGVQALGKIDISLNKTQIDYYTLSAHKINGPKGVGALYIANPNKFKPFVLGGGQEINLRAGTENIAGIHAFKVAIDELKQKDFKAHKKAILENLSGDYILVSNDQCVDNIISICFRGVRGETIEHMLEDKGILIGTGSACNSKAGKNRVVSQLVPNDYIDGAVRLSFGDEITVEDCIMVSKELCDAVKTYRERIKK